MSVVINYDTGEIVRGKIERPPVEFLIKEVLIPFARWNDKYIEENARKSRNKEGLEKGEVIEND